MELIQDKYKQTDVGLIPSDWSLVKFKDVSFMKGRIGWQGLNQTEFTNNSEEPFLITGMNFKDGEIRWNEVYHVSNERYEIAKEIQLKINDVLMTKDGTIGKLLFVSDIPYPHKATLNSHLLVFRPLKNSYNPKYLYYNLASPYFDKHIELTKSGTTFFGVSQTSVGEYNIILPSINEQTAIANALSDADNWINSLEQLIAKKRLIKQGAMQELLKPKEGWEVKTLRELCNYQNGTSLEKYFNSKDGFKVISIGNYSANGKFVKTGSYIDKSNESIIKKFILNKNELTMILNDKTSIGTIIGRVLLIDKDDEYVFNQRTMRLIPNLNMSSAFLYHLINSDGIHNKIVAASKPGTQIYVNTNDITDLILCVPDLKEQNRIATIFCDMDAEITSLEEKSEKAKQVKLGMMQELLTGRIRLV